MKDEKKTPPPADAVLELDPNSELPPDADVEERFNQFWKERGPAVFGVLALIAVVVVGFEAMRYLGVRKGAALEAEYATLESAASKLEFAKANSDRKIGGLAYLDVADSDYTAGAFDTAAEHYAAAETGLTETPLIGRARLGAALSKLRSGEAAAFTELEMVARDPSLLGPYRGEAAYLLAVAQWEAGDADAVQRALDLLGTIDDAGTWQALGLELERVIPELRDGDVASADS